jgi:hypothetical protein
MRTKARLDWLREALRNPAQQTRVHSAARFATDATPPGCALRETREIQRRGNRGEATLAVPWRDSGSEAEKRNRAGKNQSENRRRKLLENRRRGSPGGANLCAAHAVTAASSSRERDSHGAIRSSGVGTESCGGTRIKEKLRASAVGERRRRRVFRDKNKTRARSACLRRKTSALTSRDPQHGRHEAA